MASGYRIHYATTDPTTGRVVDSGDFDDVLVSPPVSPFGDGMITLTNGDRVPLYRVFLVEVREDLVSGLVTAT